MMLNNEFILYILLYGESKKPTQMTIMYHDLHDTIS